MGTLGSRRFYAEWNAAAGAVRHGIGSTANASARALGPSVLCLRMSRIAAAPRRREAAPLSLIPMSPLIPVLVLLASSALWGLTWLPLKNFGEHGIQGPVVTLFGHGSVGLVALPWLFSTRREWRAGWKDMAGIAFFCGAANISFASAMLLGDVTRVMALFYLLPAWGVLGGRLLLDERIDAARAFSVVLALAGAFLIVGGVSVLSSPPSLVDALAVLAGLAFALNNVLFRKAAGVAVPTKVAATFAGTLAWAALIVLLAADGLPQGIPAGKWAQVVAFGAVWILLASAGTMWAVHHMEAGRSSVLIIMELVTAVASASLILGERPTQTEWAGGALIVLSAVLEARRGL